MEHLFREKLIMKCPYLNLILIILILFAVESNFASAIGQVSWDPFQVLKESGTKTSDTSYSTYANQPQTSESSHREISIPSSSSYIAAPMNISKRILSPKREAGYFMDDVIEVQITATSLKKEALENIEFWEIPGNGLEILNCSYPIETSAIYQKIDYENSDKSNLAEYDIVNISQIKYELKNSKKNSISRIRDLLSPRTRIHLNDSNYSEAILKFELVDDFNKILNNKTDMDLNASFFSPSPTVLNDGLDYWINNNINSTERREFIDLQDYRLIKRRLLELAFNNDSSNGNSNKGIRWLPFSKQHENLQIERRGPLKAILYRSDNLREGESVVFKYYLRPKEKGTSEIRSIIKSDGYIYDAATPIKIIDRDPNFDYAYWCETKDLHVNEPENFTYIIKYLGGDKEERDNFVVNVEPIESCKVNWIYVKKDNKTLNGSLMENSKSLSLPLNFTRGLLKEILVNAVYTKTGRMYSPPAISIENTTSKFEADISVYDWNNWIREHYEIITLIVLIVSTVLINFGFQWKQYRLQNEQLGLQREQHKDAKSNSKINKDSIDNNTDVIKQLSRLIDEKIK
jgi:hypothetical protein